MIQRRSSFLRSFMVDLLMQDKFRRVKLISRSWRTCKTNQITPDTRNITKWCAFHFVNLGNITMGCETMRMETQIQFELPTSHASILVTQTCIVMLCIKFHVYYNICTYIMFTICKAMIRFKSASQSMWHEVNYSLNRQNPLNVANQPHVTMPQRVT